MNTADNSHMDRRAFLKNASVVAGGVFLASRFSSTAFAAPVAGDGPYGPRLATNADGIQLPNGFTSRLIATSGVPIANTSYTWHFDPDGGACVPLDGGGWVYVSNCETTDGKGGVSAIAFDAAGAITNAYSILSGTTRSCSGGMTPWGTYLSGEENGDIGRVFECNPMRRSQGVHRRLLGAFAHEMITVDPGTGVVYMVEDRPTGRLYRFEPLRAGDLTAGNLFAARVASNGSVSWESTNTVAPNRTATTVAFNGGEGAWIMRGSLYFTTKGDVRVWQLNLRTQELSVFYDASTVWATSLDAVDNLVGHDASGDLFVAEDGGNLEVGLLNTYGAPTVAPFLRFVGHDQSEVSGIAFNPDGTRFYVASQRGTDGVTGRVYEISGRFRRPKKRFEFRTAIEQRCVRTCR